MKSFIVFTALVALTVAGPLNKPYLSLGSQYQDIVDAINSPSTDLATADKLREMLQQLVLSQHPDISPVLVVDEPPFDGHEIADAPATAPASPLVQIIINVNQPNTAAPTPVDAGNASDDVDSSPISDLPDVPAVDDLPPPVTGIIVADNLPLVPVTGIIVADNLPAPPVSAVGVAVLPAPPATGVVVADVPATPVLGVGVADLPLPPSPFAY